MSLTGETATVYQTEDGEHFFLERVHIKIASKIIARETTEE